MPRTICCATWQISAASRPSRGVLTSNRRRNLYYCESLETTVELWHLGHIEVDIARTRYQLEREAMQEARYIRIYNDEFGESHFDDLVVGLPPVDFAPPAPPLNFARLFPAKDGDFLEFRRTGPATCHIQVRGARYSVSWLENSKSPRAMAAGAPFSQETCSSWRTPPARGTQREYLAPNRA